MFKVCAFACFLLSLCSCTPQAIQSENKSKTKLAAGDESIQFWGHACFYIRSQRTHLMTDPVFDLSYSPTSQRTIPVPDPKDYQNVQVVLITHAHPDHLSLRTLKTFPESTIILCPKASAPYLKPLKQKVITMNLWDIETLGPIRIYAVPALHAGGRRSILKNADGRALGYVIQNEKDSIYISGDTEYHEDMKLIQSRFKPNIAILNINSHLPAKDALRTAKRLDVKKVIPAHHGAYKSPYAGFNRQWRRELREQLGERYHELKLGEFLDL